MNAFEMIRAAKENINKVIIGKDKIMNSKLSEVAKEKPPNSTSYGRLLIISLNEAA